ncbi:hypothetical protein HK107_00620 [Parvularcula sp. ZS-1/3]|uniref:OmpR/PhoB-type domain-containing protein n=1 Tax=Parvularcula mediterranea TaxID=2732508 RepID=A0A7Y3RIS0_9PROT|nr:winged helix-turn-helix domain-containing protein [Parvularcula mediterranea]NNU14823.1 hypothetical protein [Parvularcula mediterranea]
MDQVGGQTDEATGTFQIGAFTFERDRNLLIGEGGETTLEPKVADLLARFVRSPGEVLSRGALLDDVWGTRIGSDESLTRAVSLLRKAFKSDSDTLYIETVPKRGYCLSAPVSLAESAEPEAEAEEIAEAPLDTPPAESSTSADLPSPVSSDDLTEAGHQEAIVLDQAPQERTTAQEWPLGRVIAYASSSLFKMVGVISVATLIIGSIFVVMLVRQEGTGIGGASGIAIGEIAFGEGEGDQQVIADLTRGLPAILMANNIDYRSDAQRAALILDVEMTEASDGALSAAIELRHNGSDGLVWYDTIVHQGGDVDAFEADVLGDVGHTIGCAIRGFDVWDMGSRFLPVAMKYCAKARNFPTGIEQVEAAELLLDVASDNASVWAVHAVAHARWAFSQGATEPPAVALASLEQALSMENDKDEATVDLAEMLLGEMQLSEKGRENALRKITHKNGPLRNLARQMLAEELTEQGRLAEAATVRQRLGLSDPGHPAYLEQRSDAPGPPPPPGEVRAVPSNR